MLASLSGGGYVGGLATTDLVGCDDCVVVDESATVAYVTGASRGIGRLIALSLARGGATVVGFARPSTDLDTLSLETVTGVIRTHPLDVTNPSDVQTAFARVAQEVGTPTLLVTCAGSIDALGPIATVDPDRWWEAIAVDLRGTMLCARTALAMMVPADAGRIVTVYGNLGDDGRKHLSAFAVAKAGVARFTETLASELDGTDVVALCIHPGFVRTPMTERLAESDAGRRWLPEFGVRAKDHWGDGSAAVELVERIVAGEADTLAGRIIYAGEDLEALAERSHKDHDLRRLRIQADRS